MAIVWTRLARFALAPAICLSLLASAPVAHAEDVAEAQAGQLNRAVHSVVERHPYGGQASVAVWNASTGAQITAIRATTSRVPASNMKIYVAAAALRALGPTFRFATRIAYRGNINANGTLRGSVWLVGGGDPSLATRAFGEKNYGSGNYGNLDSLAAALYRNGIRRVTGHIYVDETFLDRKRYVDAWPAEYRYEESPALGALTANQGYLGSRLEGDVTRQPAKRSGQLLRSLMNSRGITVDGSVSLGTLPSDATVAATVLSPQLSTLVRRMNRHSDNFFAEILLKDMGKIAGKGGTTTIGIRVARSQLSRLKINMDAVTMVDGSGLSARNRITARNTALLLHRMDVHPILRWSFRDSLARSGYAGTLKDRLDVYPYRGRVRAKTGTLPQSVALSGYATRLSGRRFIFSVVVSNPGSYDSARRLTDNIAAAIVN